jgi:hypothetical protein
MYDLVQDDEKIKKFENDYHTMVKDIDKIKYDQLIKKKELICDFLKNKIYCTRAGLFPLKKIRDCQKKLI